MVNAFLITSFILVGLFLLGSVVNMFFLGPRKFLLQLRILAGFKVDKSLYKETTLNLKYGSSTIHQAQEKYYFFVNIKSDTQVVVFRSMSGFLSYPTIHYINKVNDVWEYEEIKVSNNSCLLTQILKELMSRKMKKHVNDSTLLEGTGDLDNFINNHLRQLVRDKKINSLLK